VELDTPTIDLPAEVAEHRLVDLAVSGITLLAQPC